MRAVISSSIARRLSKSTSVLITRIDPSSGKYYFDDFI